MSNELQHYQ